MICQIWSWAHQYFSSNTKTLIHIFSSNDIFCWENALPGPCEDTATPSHWSVLISSSLGATDDPGTIPLISLQSCLDWVRGHCHTFPVLKHQKNVWSANYYFCQNPNLTSTQGWVWQHNDCAHPTHPQKLNVKNTSAVTNPILMKLYR